MITLITKDGSKVGNAILYGGGTAMYTQPEPKEQVLFFVETDFGNHMQLSWAEIEELWTVGQAANYSRWRSDRDQLINEKMHVDGNAYLPGTLVGVQAHDIREEFERYFKQEPLADR